ncbi:hypothetical protein [Streptococcus danieliae]|uniref:hypothetical protein n=1 Tax=Streptococcus danieliae TaxID=747656 RepID=UPI0021CA915B|nr:hypothetical protein [Streptococcus danieliae]MCU0081878.1 hypothetical protein [Streptococcus danieliae]
MREIDQALYDAIFLLIEKSDYPVYPYLPDLDTQYPFFVMGSTQHYPDALKNGLSGRLNLDIHFWSEADNRRMVSDSLGKLKMLLDSLGRVEEYRVFFDMTSTSSIVVDNSTDETLLHGVLNAEFKYLRGEK